VAGDSGGAAEAVVDGATGLVVDGRDAGSVAGAIVALLGDPARRRSMGRAGRARAEERFAWPRLAERAARFLREAADTA
jgi:phosphatidylinositol alpha-1,6-mannosyltransferase